MHLVTLRSSPGRVPQSPGERCEEEEVVGAQLELQQCTHSITTKLHHTLEELQEGDHVVDRLCTALEDVSRECVHHLRTCLEEEELQTLRDSHLDHLTHYLTRLAGDKLEDRLDISLDNCQDRQDRDYRGDEASTDSVVDTSSEESDRKDLTDKLRDDGETVSQLKNEKKNTKIMQENSEFEKSFSVGHNVNFLLLLYSLIKMLLL